MEENLHGNSQPDCIEWLTVIWHTLDKKQVATIRGVAVTSARSRSSGCARVCPGTFHPSSKQWAGLTSRRQGIGSGSVCICTEGRSLPRYSS
jgi:hypothetical protein